MRTLTGRQHCTLFASPQGPRRLALLKRRMYSVVDNGLRVWTKGWSRWGRHLRYSGMSPADHFAEWDDGSAGLGGRLTGQQRQSLDIVINRPRPTSCTRTRRFMVLFKPTDPSWLATAADNGDRVITAMPGTTRPTLAVCGVGHDQPGSAVYAEYGIGMPVRRTEAERVEPNEFGETGT